MKLVPPEPVVDLYNEGFEKGDQDLLDRRKAGAALSRLLTEVEDPLVVALDGRWGTGKTYFLKRWVGQHHKDHCGATVVYLDAFAHDYLDDPLVALTQALASQSHTSDAEKAAFKKAGILLAKSLALRGLDALVPGVSRSLEEVAKVFVTVEDARTVAMQDFRKALKDMIAPPDCSQVSQPAVIVIDELDRCRPDYALAMLEVIKHFFTVPHLHFVLGVNLAALKDMVRTRYGSGIEAATYLGKFIQVTLALPDEIGPDHNREKTVLPYLDHLVQTMDIKGYIARPLRAQVKIAASNNTVSLRDIGKIVSAVALASPEVVQNPQNMNFLPSWIEVMNDLIIAQVIRPDLYPKFLSATITHEEIVSYFGATESVVKTFVDDKYNQGSGSDVAWRYHTWLWVVHDGAAPENDPGSLSTFADFKKCFYGPHSYNKSPKRIPMTIHRQWLDRFAFYQPDQS